jgi:hypothetical protein
LFDGESKRGLDQVRGVCVITEAAVAMTESHHPARIDEDCTALLQPIALDVTVRVPGAHGTRKLVERARPYGRPRRPHEAQRLVRPQRWIGDELDRGAGERVTVAERR